MKLFKVILCLLLVHVPLVAQTYQQYVVVSGTSKTFVKADCGRRFKFTSASSVAVTLPRAGTSTGRFPSGCNLYVYVAGNGTVTITPTTSTIAGNANLPLVKGQHVTISSDGTNYDVTQQDLTDAQRAKVVSNTLSGQTIDGDDNTVQDLPYSAIKSTSRSGSGTKLTTILEGAYGASDESLPAVSANTWLFNSDSNHLFYGRGNGAAWDQQFLAGSGGTINVANGGTGVATITGVIKGNGTSAFSAATAGTDYTTPSSTESPTNKTFNAESTGNVLTTVEKIWLGAAGCVNTTAASFWDLPTSTPAVATCVTGTNTQKGVLAFADTSGGFSAQTNFLLPADWTGTIDVRIVWSTSATSGNVKWSVASISTAIDATETDDPAFNSYSTVTTAAPGTANRLQTSAITGLTITGVSVSELLHLKIFRDGNDAADTVSATVNLVGVEVILRRAQ